ncbi:MAG: cell wall hydrolase [Peptostreptococcales bacterium]
MIISKRKAKAFLIGLLVFLTVPSSIVNAASYTVTSGDSLYSIGKLFNTPRSTIMKDNSLSSEVIYPGQKLNVPSDTYTVKSEDTLYLIGKKYKLSLFSLRKANNQWGNMIYPGQKIILPGIVSGNNQVSPQNKAVIVYTASDVDLLARLITAEADGEPYNAKVGVGGVVVNRILDSRFPNSISAVIYQKSDGFYQFEPVENGWIHKPASADAKKAAYDALHGNDQSRGAVFYFDDSATNKWLWSKPITAKIGRMIFVY